MNTPFEDLEYLADYLPDEGEAMLVSRRDGELVCEPFAQETGREGIADPEFYGRLIQASERLSMQSTLPLWVCLIGCFWGCVALHMLTGIGWVGAFFDIGLVMMALMGGYCWIRYRHQNMFRQEIRPMLEREIRRRSLQKYAVIGAIRQHPEMRSLMDELSLWTEEGRTTKY